MKQAGFNGGYAAAPTYNNTGFGEYQHEHAEGYGWRQEYSQGAGPEYEAEALWSTEADEEFAQVHVFGPSGEQIPPAVTSFQQAQELFPNVLIHKLLEAGFTAPTPIQAHTWAIGVAGRDLIGIAKTGSGKTLAFLMPGFLKITQSRSRFPQLCVLAPTRELACQIEAEAREGLLASWKMSNFFPSLFIFIFLEFRDAEALVSEAEKFGRAAGIRTVCCYGGAPRGQQLGALRRGAQVIVACPGRLNDFLQSGSVSLSNVSYLVLDEADRMLDMGFEPQIRQVTLRQKKRLIPRLLVTRIILHYSFLSASLALPRWPSLSQNRWGNQRNSRTTTNLAVYCHSLGLFPVRSFCVAKRVGFLFFTEATWPREVRSLASEFLQRPIHVQTGAVHEMTVAWVSFCQLTAHWIVNVLSSKVNKDIEQRVNFCSDEADKDRE